jgi:hypothetical protein
MGVGKKKTIRFVNVIFAIAILVMILGNGRIAEAKVNSIYASEQKVVLEGKLKKIKYYYAGEWQVNYVLYTHPKFCVEHSNVGDGSIQDRICVYITKAQWKKYKNQKVRIKGTMTENSPYYCTTYGLYNIKKIKKIKKWK